MGSVWENLYRGRNSRPNAVRSVDTMEVKILPYRSDLALSTRHLLYGKNKSNLIYWKPWSNGPG